MDKLYVAHMDGFSSRTEPFNSANMGQPRGSLVQGPSPRQPCAYPLQNHPYQTSNLLQTILVTPGFRMEVYAGIGGKREHPQIQDDFRFDC